MSYLIKTGSLDNFSIQPTTESINLHPEYENLLGNIRTFSALKQMKRSIARDKMMFEPLPQKGGLGLDSFTLYKSFEGFMNLFNPQNEIYFIAWTWDLSGAKPYVYPAIGTDEGKWFNRMKKDDTIKFIGQGLNLYPKQEIKGGIGVHIEVWESDSDVRKAGETIEQITTKIQESELTQILTGIAGTNPTTATIAAISQAVLALSKIIGSILKNNSDDFVNLFEGYYDADSWTNGSEVYKNPINNPTCEIILNKF